MMFSITDAMIGWIVSLGYAAATHRFSGAPDELVTVERTGGPVRGWVDHPTIAVQCWAPTERRAEEMANELRLALITRATPAGIHKVRADSGPYPYPDQDSRIPRYQFVLNVSCQLTTE